MTPAAPTPAAAFAALWPDLRRYAGRASARTAERTGVDREDLFAAAALAVWQAVRRGAFAGHPNPKGLLTVVVKRAAVAHARRQIRFARERPAGAWGLGSAAGDAPFLETVPDRAGPEPLSRLGFDDLLALARPADRDVLARRFRGGESEADTARRYGVTRQRIGQRIDASLKRIRKQLQPRNALDLLLTPPLTPDAGTPGDVLRLGGTKLGKRNTAGQKENPQHC